MSELLVDKTSSETQTTTDSWVDVVGLSETVDVNSTSDVLLMTATVNIFQDDTADETIAIRFAVDDVQEGPELTMFKDNTNEGCGNSISWVKDGISGSTKFAVQVISVASKHAVLDTAKIRAFQVIAITDATILVNKTSSDAYSAQAGYTDITGLTDTQTVTSGAILLLLGNFQHLSAAEDIGSIGFTIGGTLEGPEGSAAGDDTDEGCGGSVMWAKSGVSGSTAFALQCDEIEADVATDTNRVSSLQVVQITANVNLLTVQTSEDADDLEATYTDVVGLDDTISVDSTGSILIFGATAPLKPDGSDATAIFRFYEGTTGEGPEVYVFNDAVEDVCGHSLYWANTGNSAGNHTFSLRGKDIAGTPAMSETLRRSLMILELTAAAASVGNTVPLLMRNAMERRAA